MSQPSKQITLVDLAELFRQVAHPNGSGYADGVDLSELLEDLAGIACKHFGGEVARKGADDDIVPGEPMVTIRADERVSKTCDMWAQFDPESDDWPGIKA